MQQIDFLRQSLTSLQDMWTGAAGVLYLLDHEKLSPATIQKMSSMMLDAINPIHQMNQETRIKIQETHRKLLELEESVSEQD